MLKILVQHGFAHTLAKEITEVDGRAPRLAVFAASLCPEVFRAPRLLRPIVLFDTLKTSSLSPVWVRGYDAEP